MFKYQIMPKKAVFLIALIIVSGLQTMKSQTTENSISDNNSPFWSQVRFGGSLGLSVGSDYISVEIAPSALYDFNKTFSAGVGINAAYGKVDNFKATSVGGSLIGIVRPISSIQISTELQESYINRKIEYIDANDVTTKDWVPALFLGLGYTTGPFTVGLKYDVLYDDDKSINNSALLPFVSIYF